jgi:cell division protein FtsL
MNRKLTILGIIAIGISVVGLFQVKYKVYNLKRDLSEINRQLAADRSSIRVLKAEWAYLNKPERVEKLASKHLKMNNISIAQVYNNQVDNLYMASNGNMPNTNANVTKPVLTPILSSAVAGRGL